MIPALIRRIAHAIADGQQTVTLWGDGSPTREFLYVEDCAEGILLACERFDDSQPVNLGSSHEVSIAVLTDRIAGLMGYAGRFVYDTSRPNGQPRRALDCSRAAELFGFRATTSLDEGLRRTIDYFRREFAP